MPDLAGALQAIEDWLMSHWNTTQVAFPNSGKPRTQDENGTLTPWAYCDITPTGSDIRGVGTPGSRVVIDEGQITVTVFTPSGAGRTLGRQHAVAIGELFRCREFYNSEPGACVRTWTPEVGVGNPASSENPSGNWWAVTMTVPFEFYHLA